MIFLWSEESENRFREQIKVEGARAFRYVCLLASFLFPLGTLLDWFTSRDHLVELSQIRWSASVLFLALFAISKSKLVRRFPYQWTLALTFFGSMTITLMCLIQDGYKSPYYAGINAIVIALGLLLPYNLSQTIGLVVTCQITYWIPILIQTQLHFDSIASLFNNAFFLNLSAVLVLAASAMRTRLKRELFERHLTLESAHRRLKHYDRLKSDFFSNISHEFRTPLTLILGSLDRLAQAALPSEAGTDLIRGIRTNALILLRHINDLLDLSKLEVGKLELKRSRVDLVDLVQRFGSLFQPIAEESKIRFSIITPDSAVASLDSEKIERILLNLLSNAFKFIGSGKMIRLELKRLENALHLEVEDDGPGISEELREKVFERFYQGGVGDSKKFGGTGLGLAIVKEFVSLHGGSVTIESSRSGGSLFRVEIPNLIFLDSSNVVSKTSFPDYELLLKRDLKDSFQDSENMSEALMADHPEVLLVEDNSQMRHYLYQELSKEFSVVMMSTGHDALSYLETKTPEIIVSDLMMPEMSGIDLFRRLKRHNRLKEIPFIFLTAKADEETRLRTLSEGAHDYLAKPFSVVELMAKIRNALILVRSRERLKRELNTQRTDLDFLTHEIIEQKQKLEVAVHSLTLARDEALEASSTKSRFLGFISHELRNPLAVVRITSRMIGNRNDLSPQNYEMLVQNLMKSADQLQSLIETLLDYSRVVRGKFVPQGRELVLKDLVAEILSECRLAYETKGLDIRLEGESFTVNSDPMMIRHIVLNLISNAIKYTEKGFVYIDLRMKKNSFVVSVRDSGIGIKSQDLQKIFEEFERLPGPQSFVPGLGLGLSLVRVLTSSLKGKIFVESTFGEGSCFTVELPQMGEQNQIQSMTP